MDLFKSIITNAAFLGVFTLIVGYMFNRGLQKQKRKFDDQLLKQKGEIDKEIEKLKGDLQLEFSKEQERLNQKRNVYINLINTMAVFIGKRVPENERVDYQKNFLKAYDVSWLWASDDVLLALSRYMQFKIENNHLFGQNLPVEEARRLQLLEKEYFSDCVLVIRKDIGFTESILTKEDYKFINF
ncbi:hypothetical protein SOP93_22120 [Peribacillus frigoritolerans]|uniref:hypothetical protein n=1 Tax=Peribacillus frigoritolerans TaxID=450367 RepID=UPI002B254602|nr:hypothetical protein [Peribacillus frigoritolerans]MEB2493831.1 hypothetical protein [Peribacillus frigoritolerans]